MSCLAYFNGNYCTKLVPEDNTWCSYHAKFLIKIRKQYKSIEKLYYDSCGNMLANLQNKTVPELQKMFHHLSQAIDYRNLMTEIGYNPENRDYGHELWIYKLEQDRDTVEKMLEEMYEQVEKNVQNMDLEDNLADLTKSTKPSLAKLDNSTKPDNLVKSNKKQEKKKITLKIGKRNIDFELEKYGKKSWNAKDIAKYIYGFGLVSLQKTIKDYCTKKFGEYGLRFYWYCIQYVRYASITCCCRSNSERKKSSHARIDQLEQTENEMDEEDKEMLSEEMLHIYVNLSKFDKDIDLPPHVLEIYEHYCACNPKMMRGGYIFIPLDLCLKAAMNDDIHINVDMELKTDTLELVANIDGFKHVEKCGYHCFCNTIIALKYSKESLVKEFPNIVEMQKDIIAELKKIIGCTTFHLE